MKYHRVISKAVGNRIRNLLIGLGMDNSPDFLIIGAQKAGTVALIRYLDQHDSLKGAKKEISFFSTNNFIKGITWYKRNLPVKLSKKTLVYEKTPEYIYYPGVPKLIHEFKPDIKLILIVRDPIKRAFSGWNHYRKYYYSEGEFSKQELIEKIQVDLDQEKGGQLISFLQRPDYMDFKDSILEEIELIESNKFRYNPSFVRQGIYVEQIKNYLNYFDIDQLMIIESNELRNDPKTTLNKISKFLSIHPFNMEKLRVGDAHISNYNGLGIDEESRSILRKFYDPYNKELYKLLGRKFEWE